MEGYLPRVVDTELDDLLTQVPALTLEGPKGVGKTETAQRRAASVYRLDEPSLRAVADADPAILLKAPRPVLLDEWQNVPPVWDAVRRAVDQDATPNRYLLTGSAAPAMAPTHSGAGRIVRVRMRPLALCERGLATPTVSLRSLLSGSRPGITGHTGVGLAEYAREIVASGFPGIRGLSGRALRAQLDGYLSRIVDRDFLEQGHRIRKPESLRRWITAYAAATATTMSFEKIRDAATGGESDKPTKVTTIGYREILERLWIVDPVPSWSASKSPMARLLQAPKHHLADPALAARALGVNEDALLSGTTTAPTPRDGALLGQLFESLVTLSVRVYAQSSEARVHHLRSREGRREIDLIVERPDRRLIAMEAKLGQVVTDLDVRHLHWVQEHLGEDLLDMVVVTTGREAYRRKDGVAVVPAVLLGP